MSHPKLVRDRIPHIIRANGDEPVTRIADPAEYRTLLIAKLQEETIELSAAFTAGDPAHVAEEAADVLEVLYTIAAHHGFTPGQLEATRVAKADRRGGFSGRIVWDGNR